MKTSVLTLSAIAVVTLLSTASAQRTGISAQSLQVFEEPTIPGKEFRVLRTMYEPLGQNPKHYHSSHIVFYVLEGEGVWQEEGKEPVTLKPGDSLHVRPGTVH